MNLQQVKIAEGCETQVYEAIETAESNDGWVVIEDLHLAPEHFFLTLKHILMRLFKIRGMFQPFLLLKGSFQGSLLLFSWCLLLFSMGLFYSSSME